MRLIYNHEASQAAKALIDAQNGAAYCEATMQDHIVKLRSYINQPFPSGDRGAKSDMESVPYTEENAKFFADALHMLCRMADQLDKFFKPDGIEARISSASSPLLAGPVE